jgi:hypothetical protein
MDNDAITNSFKENCLLLADELLEYATALPN